MEGLVLSRYQIRRKLGEGGMGVVYEADDTRLPRKVAIKVLHEDATGDDRRARFKREARAASALNHPNIVTVHDIESTVERDFIVMELVEGESLHTILARGPLPLTKVIEYAAAMASACGAAHAAGIVHRDIKPGNVMVTADGRVKVLDFGLAKMTGVGAAAASADTVTAPPATHQGTVLGTLAYMSPEQAVGEPVDARSDVFSFGVVLYEMLTGRRPFEGGSTAATVRAILNDPPPSLSRIRRDVPPAVQRLVERCLQKDLSARYAHAGDIARELTALQAQRASAVPYRAYVATGIVVALVAGGVEWYRSRQASDRVTTLAAINEHVDAGRLARGWQLAAALDEKFPDDPEITRTTEAFTMRADVVTEPDGAGVYVRDYIDPDSEWIRFGTTPMTNARVPFAATHWKISKEGYQPFEGRFLWGPGRTVSLVPSRSAVSGMVYVTAGNAGVGEQLSMASPFWIDTFEVTNRDFKRFVDVGGYRDRQHWKHPFIVDGKPLTWESAMALLKDRTGRPGPATWEGGDYPVNQEEYPVTGVSWYEAAAYAEFAGRRLPTFAHRQRVAGGSNLREDAVVGNFHGRGPEPVRSLRDLGPFGTYGLAGNVAEWCWNAVEGQRLILGGGWNDPPYMSTRYEAKPPMDRADTNGFRTILDVGPIDERVLVDNPGGERASRPRSLQAVGDETFDAYRGFYSYDKGPLDARVEWTKVTDLWRRERVSIAAAYGGERVPMDILLPTSGRPPYQVVVWYAGSYALDLPSSEEIIAPMYFDFLVRSGRAVVLPVFKGFYERRLATARPAGTARRDVFVQRSKDLGRTIDYLESRGDIDASKVGLYAFSATTAATPLIALEPRLKTAVLLSGGLAANERFVPEIDPVNFAPRIRVPTLLMAGRHDFQTPVDTAQKPLFDLLGTPASQKRHFIFDGGHVPPRGLLIKELLDWLDTYLGPP